MELDNDMVELSAGFAQLSGEIRQAGDTPAALQRIVELAVKFIDGCRFATITQVRGGRKFVLATSDPVGNQLVELQNELGEGPGLDAAGLVDEYLVSDLITEQRWPRFAAMARKATEVRGVLAFRLAGQPPAILSIYTVAAEGFSDDALGLSSIFASQASTLVALFAAEDHSANLETALESSREIGMALGILMAHRKITDEAAFDLLRTASQNLHRKLRDVASEVMETGTLPELPPRRPVAG
ncbi:MAG TPA: GAF and ANTAR domain-containing protein [Jatrophihabitans sp.]|nr:GAF and ANTAR domain-containing protein [Jatrophihabitans sp.]